MSFVKIVDFQLNTENRATLSTAVVPNVSRPTRPATYSESATWIWLYTVVPSCRCDVRDVTIPLTLHPPLCHTSSRGLWFPPPSERDVIYGRPLTVQQYQLTFNFFACSQFIWSLVCLLSLICLTLLIGGQHSPKKILLNTQMCRLRSQMVMDGNFLM